MSSSSAAFCSERSYPHFEHSVVVAPDYGIQVVANAQKNEVNGPSMDGVRSVLTFELPASQDLVNFAEELSAHIIVA